MIILGAVLLIVGFFLTTGWLWSLGIVLLVIGVVMELAGRATLDGPTLLVLSSRSGRPATATCHHARRGAGLNHPAGITARGVRDLLGFRSPVWSAMPPAGFC
jgi:hypothetical protein